jgi:hypothetical protein
MGGHTTLMGHGVVWPSLKAKTHQFFFFFVWLPWDGRTTLHGVVRPPKLVKKVAQIFNFYFFFYCATCQSSEVDTWQGVKV